MVDLVRFEKMLHKNNISEACVRRLLFFFFFVNRGFQAVAQTFLEARSNHVIFTPEVAGWARVAGR